MGDLSDDPTLNLPFSIIHRSGPAPIVFLFPIAPQRVRVEYPSRGQISQTVTANWLDDFSGPRAVLARVTMRGTFGFHTKLGGVGVPAPGSVHLRALETIFETFNALDRQLKRDLKAVQEYIGLARLHFWRIWIDKFAYDISSTDPLLYFYELSFYRLEDYLSPVSVVGAVANVGGLIAGSVIDGSESSGSRLSQASDGVVIDDGDASVNVAANATTRARQGQLLLPPPPPPQSFEDFPDPSFSTGPVSGGTVTQTFPLTPDAEANIVAESRAAAAAAGGGVGGV